MYDNAYKKRNADEELPVGTQDLFANVTVRTGNWAAAQRTAHATQDIRWGPAPAPLQSPASSVRRCEGQATRV